MSSDTPESSRSRPMELSPLDMIALEAARDPFCPVAENGGVYHPGDCLPGCHICQDLLLKKEGAT